MNVTEYGIFLRYHCKLAIKEASGMSSPKKWNRIGTKYMKRNPSFWVTIPLIWTVTHHCLIAKIAKKSKGRWNVILPFTQTHPWLYFWRSLAQCSIASTETKHYQSRSGSVWSSVSAVGVYVVVRGLKLYCFESLNESPGPDWVPPPSRRSPLRSRPRPRAAPRRVSPYCCRPFLQRTPLKHKAS